MKTNASDGKHSAMLAAALLTACASADIDPVDNTDERPLGDEPSSDSLGGEDDLVERHFLSNPRPSSPGKAVTRHSDDDGMRICQIPGQLSHDGETRYFARAPHRTAPLGSSAPDCGAFEVFYNEAFSLTTVERDGRSYNRSLCKTFTNLELNRFGDVCEHIKPCDDAEADTCSGYTKLELRDLVEANVQHDRVTIKTRDGQLAVSHSDTLAHGQPAQLSADDQTDRTQQFLRWQDDNGTYVFRALTDEMAVEQGGFCLDAAGGIDGDQMHFWTCNSVNFNQLQPVVDLDVEETSDAAADGRELYVAVDVDGRRSAVRLWTIPPRN